MDVVSPSDLTQEFLRDYLDLPDNYFVIGAYVHSQDFLLRYGSHFIKSAEFGAQLAIVKTMKSEKKLTTEQFSEIAETEFKALTNTLQNQVDNENSKFSVLGYGH